LSLRFRAASAAALAALIGPTAALAGPPFLTDDPEPTDTGHWEIYAPLFEAEGNGADFSGAVGAEINYGPVKDVQLTVGLPIAYTHDRSGYRWGAGDLEASLKYRFFHDEAAKVQIAVFPGVSLPTGSNGMSAGHVTALLPVWAQKDFGKWSVFGGGGYAINPGAGNRDYWTGGVALTRQVGDRLLLGVEGDRQGAATIGARASTNLGLGMVYDLPGPLRLLASGGPTLGDDGSQGFHTFAAVG
jgi:Putative MetA-pathway of phenol degradation